MIMNINLSTLSGSLSLCATDIVGCHHDNYDYDYDYEYNYDYDPKDF